MKTLALVALLAFVKFRFFINSAMFDYLIYNQLKKNAKAGKCFHVPGHKARGDFKKKFPVADLDVTELSYSDNLFCPDGVIAAAQRDIAEIVGAKKSFILTDGSTSGVLAMLYVMSRRGNKLIVPRNSHQSVWNACRLFDVEPVIVQGECKHGVLLPPDPKEIDRLLLNDVNISGMIVTSPDYYGNIAPLDKYAEALRRNARILAVDGAHGAHLAFESEGVHAGKYADMWVDGAHKSLPVLTQGAVVSVNNEKLFSDLQEALSIFRTTSPSYPVMASVEYGFKYLKNNDKILREAKKAVADFRRKCAGLTLYPSDDWTKLCADFKPLNISSDAAARALERKKIYAELSDGRYLVFYLSPATTAKDLTKLQAALLKISKTRKLKGTYRETPPLPAYERTYSFQYALKKSCERAPLSDAVSRMSARNVCVTPPCIPVIVAGEIITAEAVDILTKAKNTVGVEDGKVWVVKK